MVSRRDFLRIGGLASTTLSLAACRALGQNVANDELPESLVLPESPESDSSASISPVFRFLNRAGYGATADEHIQAVEMGLEAYLEVQLNPESIEDRAANLMLRNFNIYQMEVEQIIDQDEKDVAKELLMATATRAIYSNRQLYETMVEFWSDHFNIYLRKNDATLVLKLIDDRDVIRPNALGSFRDLLFASAQSPAMLVYLDNIRNQKEAPVENYARELMELHTLGVDSGYSQADIGELSRILTGWGVGRHGRNRGLFLFDSEQHDFDEKTFLGHSFSAGQGEEDVHQALEILITHPSTAQFVATKLVRRFVADDPPSSLVTRVAQTFTDTDGDIKSMLRVIFLSEEFANAPPKLKRPYTFLISALRILFAEVKAIGYERLGGWLRQMGQLPFHWPYPDGYPDVTSAWATNLLPRWNFSLALMSGQVNGISVPLERLLESGMAQNTASALDFFARLILGQALDTETMQLFSDYIGNGDLNNEDTKRHLTEAIALMLASPAFQWI